MIKEKQVITAHMLTSKEDLQLGAAEYRMLRKRPVVQEGDWGRTSVTSAVRPCNDARHPKTRSHGEGEGSKRLQHY